MIPAWHNSHLNCTVFTLICSVFRLVSSENLKCCSSYDVFDHMCVIQRVPKSRKTSPSPEALTWPLEMPTTLAFLSWQMLMVGCLSVASLCSSPVLWEKVGGFMLLNHPNAKPHLPHVWCLPITLLTSEADPKPAGCSLKPHTFTTQSPPAPTTFLPLTYHLKHYHKLLPDCQTTQSRAHSATLPGSSM